MLVYCASLDAYCTVQGLLSRGVPASSISLAQPPSTAADCFYDPRVLAKVHEALGSLGIQVRAPGGVEGVWRAHRVAGVGAGASVSASVRPLLQIRDRAAE